MSTVNQILSDIDLRYRNTFTLEQKLVWFNEEQRELFDVLELDSAPYTFQTVEDEHFYPFPDQFDVTKIKTVSYQVNDVPDPDYVELPFKENDDHRDAPYARPWYTVVSDALYLYTGEKVPDGRNVYIYCDSDPQEVTSANLDVSPDLPTKYQEILKLGILKRIAMARKDVQMYNNYTGDYEQKIADVMWERKLKEPEWSSPIDMMPRAGWRGGWQRWPYVIMTTE